VPVGHAEAAEVHQPARVRAVVLRLGARQVVVTCNIYNTCARASVAFTYNKHMITQYSITSSSL
jgi:hypothetical protein